MKNKYYLLLMPLFLIACSPESADTSVSPTAVSEVKKTQYQNAYQIGAYTSSPWGFETKSYWIEGPQGVVLIDTQFLPSAANEVVDIAESVTGKKVVMAIVLHANADRFNGTAALQSRGIQVVSSKQVVELIPEVDKINRGRFFDRYAPDYPEKLTLPDVAWEKTQEFDVAGLRFKAYVIRSGVSGDHVLIGLDHHLFVGDLVVNKYHARLESGNTGQWLDRLEEIRKFAQPKVIHPGHGYAMSAEALLSQQELYLNFVRKAIAEFYTGGEITQKDTDDIITKVKKKYPQYEFDVFLNLGIPAVWEQIREKDHETMSM